MRRQRTVIGKERQSHLLAGLRIERLDAPQPGGLLRIIDLPQIQHLPLYHPPARAAPTLHDRPVAMFLAVLEPTMTFEMPDGLPS